MSGPEEQMGVNNRQLEGSEMRLTGAIAAALMLCVAVAAQPSLLTAYYADTPPLIDGQLDDTCWQGASAATPFVRATGLGQPEEQTIVRMCWDERNLYLGIRANESYLEPRLNMLELVRAEHTQRDAAIFSDDVVEVFLQPPGASYCHLAVNSIGTIFDQRDMDTSWDAQVEVAARRGADAWTAEIALALESLQASPTGEWRANFTRQRTAVEELSTWSGLQGAFHQPALFGELRFARSGPAFDELQISEDAGGVRIDATIDGRTDGARLTGVAIAEDEEARAEVEGAGQQSLRIETPQSARTTGLVRAQAVLLVGDTPVQRSAQVPISVGVGRARLAVRAQDASVTAWLNGREIAVGADPTDLDIEQGLNVLAIHARRDGDEPRVTPSVTAGSRALPLSWLMRAEAPSDGWQDDIDPEGWEIVAPEDLRWPGGSAEMLLMCGLYAGESEPQLFPKLDTFHIPRDSSQLMRLYLHAPQDIPSDQYAMVIETPADLGLEAVWEMGTTPPEVTGERTRLGDTEMMRRRLAYEFFPGQGMELSMRWGDRQSNGLGYETALSSGGTHGWRRLSTTITAPEGAASLRPLIIKWQNRGITGTFWVDNVVVRERDGRENLLPDGTFDGAIWEPHHYLVPEGPDGSMAVKITSTQANADSQQAFWVVPEGTEIPVTPGHEYIVEMDVRCEELGSPNSRPLCGLLFRAAIDATEGEQPILTYFQTLNGAVTELPHTSTANILPPLKNVRPERARLTPCYYSSRLANDDVGRAYAESCWESGITWTYGKYANNVVEVLAPRGHKVILSIGWHGWNTMGEEMLGYLEQHPEVQAINFEGKPERDTFCPTWMLSEAGRPAIDMLEAVLLDMVNEYPYAGANWDLEQSVVDPPTFCTCPRCIDAFRQYADLAADVEITRASLLNEYRDAWVDFRCAQNAEMAGRLKSIYEKAERPIEFSVYSGFQSTRTREHYGVDWAKMAPHIDLAIAGYGGSAESVAATVEALGDVPLMGGEMWYLHHSDDSRAAPKMETWRNRVLRKFIESGCEGVLIWQLASMDGGAFYATSEAAAIIAENEEWLVHEQRCDDRVTVDGLEKRNWAAFERDGDVLVVLMSFDDAPIEVGVSVDGEAQTVEVPAYGTELVLVR